MTENRWILYGKAEVAECFDISVNSVTAWVLRGCPVLPAEGKHKYRFDIRAVIKWLSLSNAPDSATPDLTTARARLAESQTRKTEVEVRLKEAQLGHVLAGGTVPVAAARDLFNQGELLVMQGFAKMAVQVPADFFTDYLKELAEKRGEQFRLATMIDDWRFPVRDEFRSAARNLLARFLGEQGQSGNDGGAPDDAA